VRTGPNCCKLLIFRTDRHQQEKEETALAVNVFKTQLFTPDMVQHCMEVLVTKYFVLKGTDLEGWADDPEHFTVSWEDATESWEFLIRVSTVKATEVMMLTWYSHVRRNCLWILSTGTRIS
jgi:hypothetical protein